VLGKVSTLGSAPPTEELTMGLNKPHLLTTYLEAVALLRLVIGHFRALAEDDWSWLLGETPPPPLGATLAATNTTRTAQGLNTLFRSVQSGPTHQKLGGGGTDTSSFLSPIFRHAAVFIGWQINPSGDRSITTIAALVLTLGVISWGRGSLRTCRIAFSCCDKWCNAQCCSFCSLPASFCVN
jgi:hypothetical protein